LKAGILDSALFKHYLVEKTMLSEGSIEIYAGVLNTFLKTNPDIDILESYNNFIIQHSIKKRSTHMYAALKLFIQYKIPEGKLKNEMLEGLIVPPLPRNIKMERKYLSEDQILDVINNIKEKKHKVIALIQTLTGVRAGDILRLKRDNIMPEEYRGQMVLRVNITGKGGKRNVIFIHDEVAQQIILDYITTTVNHEDYYFLEFPTYRDMKPEKRGNEFHLMRLNYIDYWADLKQALNMNGLDMKDFSTHDFRRCFARRVWERYKDVQILQKLLNHENPAVTLKYLQQSGLQNVDLFKELQSD
jgi:integrase